MKFSITLASLGLVLSLLTAPVSANQLQSVASFCHGQLYNNSTVCVENMAGRKVAFSRAGHYNLIVSQGNGMLSYTVGLSTSSWHRVIYSDGRVSESTDWATISRPFQGQLQTLKNFL